MSISSISANTFFTAAQVSPLGGRVTTDNSSGASGSASGPSLSRPAQFLSQLQALEQSDPAQARQVLSDLASKMRSEGSAGNSRRSQLADVFQKAADTGDLSGLLKEASGGGAGGAWSRGAAAYGHTMAVTRTSR